MNSKKKRLQGCNLYLILDASVNSYQELFGIAKSAIASGVDIVQLRDKKGSADNILKFSKEILKITRRKVSYIINDRVDIAKAVDADGVHLGQEDLSIAFARKLLGAQAIIGKSCQSLKHLQAAQKEQADYVGVGSVFKTLTKPEREPMNLKMLKNIYAVSKIPVFAIGGITLGNLEQIKNVGVNRIAVCREICLAKDVKKITREFKKKLVTGISLF